MRTDQFRVSASTAGPGRTRATVAIPDREARLARAPTWSRRSLADGDDDLAPGTPAGGYVLETSLARGGFGTVYRARHRLIDRRVAIKVMHGSLSESTEAHERFDHEARLAAQARHPNVVEIEDLGRLDDEAGRAFLTMELIEGIDLEQHLARCGRLRLAEVIRVLEHLASALDHVHACGIVHRDIKAANVMLEHGATHRVVLLDFGVAKRLDQRGRSLTQVNHVVGTPAYMAPEQIRGEETDQRTDLYALGAMTFELLTGHPPFSDTNPLLAHHMHMFAHPPSVSRFADVPPALDEVITRAMAKEPAERYPDAAEFVEAIAAASRRRPRGDAGERMAEGAALRVDLGEIDWSSPRAVRHADRQRGFAERWLLARGYVIAAHDHRSMLAVKRVSRRGSAAAQVEAATTDARTLHRQLHRRSDPDSPSPRVQVHHDRVAYVGRRPVAGPLLDPTRWDEPAPAPTVACAAGAAPDLTLADPRRSR